VTTYHNHFEKPSVIAREIITMVKIADDLTSAVFIISQDFSNTLYALDKKEDAI